MRPAAAVTAVDSERWRLTSPHMHVLQAGVGSLADPLSKGRIPHHSFRSTHTVCKHVDRTMNAPKFSTCCGNGRLMEVLAQLPDLL